MKRFVIESNISVILDYDSITVCYLQHCVFSFPLDLNDGDEGWRTDCKMIVFLQQVSYLVISTYKYDETNTAQDHTNDGGDDDDDDDDDDPHKENTNQWPAAQQSPDNVLWK